VRFTQFLHGMGKVAVSGITDFALPLAIDGSKENDARKAILRSKGFVWMGTSSEAAYFMSHAGQYLELMVLGRWWAAIPPVEWPEGLVDEIQSEYDPSSRFGDRRQELVFIGQFGARGMDKVRKELEKQLDLCLLTPKELAEYEQLVNANDVEGLKKHFFKE